MATDEPRTEYSWNVPEGAWPAWYSAHRDAALRELARLRLIEFFELERWDLPQDQLHRISNERASALHSGVQAAEVEAFHVNDGRFVEWHDDES